MKWRFVGLRFIAFGAVALAAAGAVVWGLWNSVLMPVVGVRALNYWQAIGLFLLARLLFGRFGGWGGMRKARFARGWNSLTPEERERFRRAMGPGCGGRFQEGGAEKA